MLKDFLLHFLFGRVVLLDGHRPATSAGPDDYDLLGVMGSGCDDAKSAFHSFHSQEDLFIIFIFLLGLNLRIRYSYCYYYLLEEIFFYSQFLEPMVIGSTLGITVGHLYGTISDTVRVCVHFDDAVDRKRQTMID